LSERNCTPVLRGGGQLFRSSPWASVCDCAQCWGVWTRKRNTNKNWEKQGTKYLGSSVATAYASAGGGERSGETT